MQSILERTVSKNTVIRVADGHRAVKDICSFDIKLAVSLKNLPYFASTNDVKTLTNIYRNKNYILVPDIQKRTIYVALAKDETADDVLTAYFHAVLLAITTCFYNNIPMNLSVKRQLHHVNPVVRLHNAMRSFSKNELNTPQNVPVQMLKCLDDFVTQELNMFFIALKINGWTLDTHSLDVGEWRSCWCDNHLTTKKRS